MTKKLPTAGSAESLDELLSRIGSAYGSEAVRTFGDLPADVRAIPTDLPSLDRALGVGGLPVGRVVEIFGPESAGKSTLALQLVAAVQRRGGLCAYIDAEHALVPSWAATIGVNVDDMLIAQPDSGEKALGIAYLLASSPLTSVIVVDSVAALTPEAEISGDFGKNHIGLQAKMMSEALRKLNTVLDASGVTIVFINQLREKVGVLYGSPEVCPGGRALKFYSSVRLDVRRSEKLPDGSGVKIKVRVVKNKVAKPFTEAFFTIRFDSGVDTIDSLLDVAVETGVVTVASGWYKFDGRPSVQGRDNMKTWIADNPDVSEAISSAISGPSAGPGVVHIDDPVEL